MKYHRGLATIWVAVIGLIIISGVVFFTVQKESSVPQSEESQGVEGSGTEPSHEGGETTSPPQAENPSLPSQPVSQESGAGGGATPPSVGTPEASTSPGTTPAPTEPSTGTEGKPPQSIPPASTAYDPGFKASTRITPEVPSENERATLPSCDGKLFTFDPLNLASVTSIDPGGTFNNGDPETFMWLNVPAGYDLTLYDVFALGDVWVTHIATESGITADDEDSTIYFALCRDVVGYVTHVKDLSENMNKIVTDSLCFGKPHVGENACHIEVLKLIGGGSALGKAGRIEGRLGFGVIDLRTPRSGASSAYPVKVNFAACPFSFMANKDAYTAKLSRSGSLCTK